MENMNIQNAKYFEENGIAICISCILNGKNTSIPIVVGNRHYDEIMRQVEAGTLTIQEAD